MKTSNTTFCIHSILFVFSLFLFPACSGDGEQKQEIVNKPDTTFVPIIDTIVVFDPETNIETIKIVKSTDTIINNNGDQKQAYSNKPDTSFTPRIDTVVILDPKTNKETILTVQSKNTKIRK